MKRKKDLATRKVSTRIADAATFQNIISESEVCCAPEACLTIKVRGWSFVALVYEPVMVYGNGALAQHESPSRVVLYQY